MSTYKNFVELEKKLGYEFTQKALLEEALTHKSFSNESKNQPKSNYERLEFLGDAVLELAISENLIKRFLEKAEGELSKARSLLVREELLVKIARSINLGDFLILGKGEQLSGGKKKDSILACSLEAIIGAIHLDGGFAKALKSIEFLWKDMFSLVFTKEFDIDHKTRLQEFLQAKYKKLPTYEFVRSFGPEHSKLFEVKVTSIDKIKTISGIGKSKKEAEQVAAHKTFKVLQEGGVL